MEGFLIPKLPNGKQQLSVYIKKSILQDLRTYVKSKNEGMYGLSLIVEKAITNYLSKYNSTAARQAADEATYNKQHKVWELKRQLREYLSKTHKIPIGDLGAVPKGRLEEAISQIKGSDPRTLKSHFNALLRSNCLMDLHNGSFDIS